MRQRRHDASGDDGLKCSAVTLRCGLRLIELKAKVKGNHASMSLSTLAIYGSNSTEASNNVLET